jgi:hypothetical protein
MHYPLTALGLAIAGAVQSLATPALNSQYTFSSSADVDDHSHAGHDHSDAKHMYEVHGIYRAPAEDGYVPMPLVGADLLQGDYDAMEGGDGESTADSM